MGRETIGIGDALQILMYLAKMEVSVINQGGQGSRPWNAAIIHDPTASAPRVIDALEILMYLAKMESALYKSSVIV